jgi:hypothetical protein
MIILPLEMVDVDETTCNLYRCFSKVVGTWAHLYLGCCKRVLKDKALISGVFLMLDLKNSISVVLYGHWYMCDAFP